MAIHKKRIFGMYLTSFLLFLTFLSGLALSTPRTMAVHEPAPATDIVDVININVPVSCSMSATGTDSHTANVNNGQTTGNIGTTNLKVICNDNSGYAIYAIGYTDDTYGKTVLTSSTLGSTHDIATATTVTTGTSSWSMKLASVSGTYAPIIAGSTGDSLKETGDPDFSDYTAVPEEYTKVAYHTTSTDTGATATGSNLTTTYRAYISPSQPAGTYVGQVKYTLVHPTIAPTPEIPMEPLDPTLCPTNSICYAPNSIIIEGSMDSISNTKITSSPTAGVQSVTANSTATLIAPNYSREGYGFAGWSTDFEATSNSTIYGPNETVSTNPNDTDGLNVATTDGGAILYPVWIASKGNLQGWTGCSSLTTAPTNTRATLASITALKDTRDNDVYAVARLADGKCWMIENLRLDNTATITTANTHSPLNTNGNVTLTIDYANSTIANHLASSSDVWCNSGNAACINQTILNTNNTNIGGKNSSNIDLIPSYNANTNTAQWYSYGNYYNWYSATAGNGAYNFDATNNSVIGDLCPTGWRLPIGGQISVNTTGDFYVLTKTFMGGTEPNQSDASGRDYYSGTVDNVDLGAKASKSLRAFPSDFVHSGFFDSSSATVRSNGGNYWSNSTNSAASAFSLYLASNLVRPGNYNYSKYRGQSVRCIAQ